MPVSGAGFRLFAMVGMVLLGLSGCGGGGGGSDTAAAATVNAEAQQAAAVAATQTNLRLVIPSKYPLQYPIPQIHD